MKINKKIQNKLNTKFIARTISAFLGISLMIQPPFACIYADSDDTIDIYLNDNNNQDNNNNNDNNNQNNINDNDKNNNNFNTNSNSTTNTNITNVSSNITIYINGSLFKSDKNAFIYHGRTLIPLRAVGENLGAKFSWDGENRTVTISKGDSTIKLYIDNRLYSYTIDGVTNYDVTDIAPIIENGSTYVPLRLISNVLGLDIKWNGEKREITVNNDDNFVFNNFFDINIGGINDNATITDKTVLSVENISSLTKPVSQVRYYFLNSTTGMGKIVAKSTDINTTTNFIPNIDNQGAGVLACVLYDDKGNFVAGTCKNITINISPKISFEGIEENEIIKDTISLIANLNFLASYIRYEFSYSNGTKFVTDDLDPNGTYKFTPSSSKNGNVSITVKAFDKNNKEYAGNTINSNIAMVSKPTTPNVMLKNIDTKNLGVIPVKLSINRNFNVKTTKYYAKSKRTGKTILLKETGWGDYKWLPGPDMAGDWSVFVEVISSKNNKAYYSNSINVTIPNKKSLVLHGIGPNQVFAGDIVMSSIANVDISKVSYVISNPYNYTEKEMGNATLTSTKVTYTPNYVNKGKRYIQAIATTTSGEIIKSEKIMVTIYIGELFGSKPITDKSNFIEFIKPLALKTQKETGMSAALQIAQAILETGWGQSLPVDKYSGLMSNNLFGIKGKGNAGYVLCSTWEEYYGSYYRIDDFFRAYKSIEDSWNDHSDLLLYLSRYVPFTEVMFDSTAGAYALRRCGYATDSKYPGKLIYIIDKYDLDKLDEQSI